MEGVRRGSLRELKGRGESARVFMLVGGGQISMIYDNMGIVYYRATNESPNQMNSLVAILDL